MLPRAMFVVKRPWWQWIFPSAFRERKYIKIINKVLADEWREHEKEIMQHYSNVMGLGQCAGECGWKLFHERPVEN